MESYSSYKFQDIRVKWRMDIFDLYIKTQMSLLFGRDINNIVR